MSKRHKMGRASSERNFTAKAKKTHVRNLPRQIMRGGIRM